MVKKKINIKNKVREYCEKEKIDKNRFIALCLSPLITETGRTLTVHTITRIYDGDTQIGLTTAGLIAAALGVELSEIFSIEK